MGRLVFVILVSSLLLASAFLQRGNIPAVKASSSIFQGDLILTGNNVTAIEGQFDINGSIIVEDISGKTRVVPRIPKGKAGASRFTRR